MADGSRQNHMHCARVYLTECKKRRGGGVNRDFYWRLFAWAQRSRRPGVESTSGNYSRRRE